MLTDKQRSALAQIAEASVAAELQTGCPAELSVAQAILESNWLQVAPGNNCFGIKDTDRFPGAQYQITKEFLNGEWRTKTLAFEVYPTLADCFTDHTRLITGGFGTPNCYMLPWKHYVMDHDLDSFIVGVAHYYATDPAYARNVTMLAHGPNVTAAIAAARQKASATVS